MGYDEALADRLRDLLAGEPGLTEKKMFGGIGFMLDGNMAVGVSRQGGLMLRVDPADTHDLLAEPGGRPFEMRGPILTGWLRVTADAVVSDDDLRRWVRVGVAAARAFPPKH